MTGGHKPGDAHGPADTSILGPRAQEPYGDGIVLLEGPRLVLLFQQQQETTAGAGPGPAQGRALSHGGRVLAYPCPGAASPDAGLPGDTLLPWHPCQLPVEFLLLLTVPVVDPDKEDGNWKRPLNCLHLAISPLVLVLTLQSGACEYPLPQAGPPSSPPHSRVFFATVPPGPEPAAESWAYSRHLIYVCAVRDTSVPRSAGPVLPATDGGCKLVTLRPGPALCSLACIKILGDFTSESRSGLLKKTWAPFPKGELAGAEKGAPGGGLPAVCSHAVPSLASWGTWLGNWSFLCLLQAVLALSDLLWLKKCLVLSGAFQPLPLGLLPVVCL